MMEEANWREAWSYAPGWADGICAPMLITEGLPQVILGGCAAISASDFFVFVAYLKKHGSAATALDMVANGWSARAARDFIVDCVATAMEISAKARRGPQAPEDGSGGPWTGTRPEGRRRRVSGSGTRARCSPGRDQTGCA